MKLRRSRGVDALSAGGGGSAAAQLAGGDAAGGAGGEEHRFVGATTFISSVDLSPLKNQ